MCDCIRCETEDCEIPYGYCHCGCGGKTNLYTKNNTRDGCIKGEPALYIKGHQRILTTPAYIINKETGCWEWQRGKNYQGYGKTYKNLFAHRVYYERYKGPIPEGYEVDHMCRNVGCVNPEHLEAVTPVENKRRSITTKLSIKKVKEIRDIFKEGEIQQKELADIYCISYPQMNKILNNKSWIKELI